MKVLFITYIVLLHLFADGFRQPPICPVISDGKYTMKYTSNSVEKPSSVEIAQGRYRKIQDTQIVDSGEVSLVSDCLYIFKSSVYTWVDTAGLSGLLNRSFGAPCTEVSGSSKDTIFFRTTYCGNLHITQNTGQLIKIKHGL
jgi:hypothetical protein